MVDFLRSTDYEDVAKIWRMSFNDTDEYIGNFFERVYKDGNALVYREEGVAVSVVFFIESQLVINGRGHSAYYMYACCTLPAYRGKGFMSVLIEESFQLATERGIEFLVLVPAEPSLYDYYSKFGFETKFYKKSAVLSRDYLAAFSKKADLTGAFNLDVFDVRQTALGLSDFLNWGTDIIKYAMFENAYTKGALAAASDGYALYTIGKDTMYIKEIMTVGDIGELFYVLLLEEDVDKFVINLPVSSPWHFEGETVSPAGMCAPVIDSAQPAFAEIKDAYIGITLG